MPKKPPKDLDRFLAPLFEASPEHLDLLLWVLNPADATDHSSFFVQSLEQAAAIVTQYTHWHVYYGVGLRDHQPHPRPRWRGGSADVRALLLLHGDVDILHPEAHKNTNLPPDIETARRIVDAIELPPSFLVHSGYGLQPIWALKEAELLQSTEDRFMAQDVAKRLHAALAEAAQRIGGYAVDATHDLSRVLRLPGSQNHKISGNPVPCTILETGPLYGGLGDFLDVLPAVTLGASSDAIEKAKAGLNPDLLAQGRVIPDAFSLMKEDKKFKQTWEKRRRDLGDGSQSAYDFSIAMLALHAGWTPADTYALMKEFRAKYRDDVASRANYLKRTLSKAMAAVAAKEDELTAVLEDIAERARYAEKETGETERETDAEGPGQLYEEVRTFLGWPEGNAFTQGCRLIDFTVTQNGTRTHHTFTIRTPDGEEPVRIGSTDVYEPRVVFSRLCLVARHVCAVNPQAARPVWSRLLARLFEVVKKESKEELTLADRLRALLSNMAAHVSLYESLDSYRNTVEQGEAFVYDATFHATFDTLLVGIKEIDREWTRLDLSNELAKISQAKFRQLSGVKRRVRYWAIPLAAIEYEGETDAETESDETLH